MKRLLTLVAMFLCCMATSFAQFSGAGSGTKSDPYQITNAVQLNEVRNHLNKAFILMNDIDLTAYLEDESPYLGWLPIGTKETDASHFTGYFDGNNKTISGLWIARGTTDYVGLFGYCYKCSIKNLTLKIVNIKGQNRVGAICGYISEGFVTNCSITGKVEGANSVGGGIGYVYNNDDYVYSLISASVDVKGTKCVGGLIGFIDTGTARVKASITSCFVQGNVTGEISVGGILGNSQCDGTISGCGFRGNVSGNRFVGGIEGGSNVMADDLSLEKCFSFVTLTSSYVSSTKSGQYSGGLCGRLIGSASDCFSRGSVSGTTNTGGLFGYANRGRIEKCYFDGTVSGQGPKVGGLIGEGSTYCNLYSSNVSISSSVASSNSTPKRVIGYAEDLSKISQCKAYNRMIVIANGSEIDPSTIEDSKQNGTGVGATTLKQQNTYSSMGWDFTNTWTIKESECFPYLKIAEEYITQKDVSSLTIILEVAVTYNGSAQTPAVMVIDGTTTLTNGTDYTVSYSNNINVGTATVTITGKGNYTGTKTATFTIQKAPLTITAKSYTIKQGEALPAFEAEYSGFKNSETSSVLTTQPTFSCSATSASAPGTYGITVSGATANNYDITHVKGALTITDADPVTVTAKSFTIEYGDDIPVFEYSSEGATLDGTPVITCEATKTSPVGTYPIVITKGTVKNYNDTYVNGTLTIKKAPLKITAKDYTIKQGEALPTFEATYEGFKNDETSEVLTKQPTITTTATSASEPGEYEITISGAEATNYELSYAKGKLTIVDADAIVITAKSYEMEYGDDLPTFEYTSEGATLDGTPSITCEATKTSPVGTYPIIITKGSVKNYNDTYVNGTLTIKKAPLKITAKDYTIKQGEALPTFEATYEGFKNYETEAVLTKQPTITTTATSASVPGEYEITISGAEATNYELSYVNGKLTIVDADALIVTAKSYEIEYGDDLPTYEYTSEGATLDGTPSITCEATKTSPVGTYPIVITKGTVKNYNDTYVNGTLTIKKAPLKITAKDYTIKQGEALPTFEATYEGFKNDETETVLTKQPTITTTATSASGPGDYYITVSGAEAQNYEISYVGGKLTITEAVPVTITAESYEIEYGDDLPTFEYTSEGATLDGTPSITCEATKTSPVGTYPIVITKGTVKNYNDTYVNGTLTIKKAPLKITAKDYTIKQGEALPTFEATYEGFKNDETEAVLTKQPTITTTATSASGPGDYYITVSGAEAQNYEISYVGGKLTIELGYIPGDANGDGLVNVTDIVATVNYIMEKNPANFNKAAADLNGDGEINVTDIVKMVSIIMSGDGGSSRRAAAASGNLVISGNNIQLRNAESYTAVQFDIYLSDGQSISDVALNGSSDHSLSWKMIDANTCRVVAYSMTNAAFRVNSDNLFSIIVNGGLEEAAIGNELLIQAEGVTGINAIRKEAENGKVYDLNGRQVKTPRKGVYIINGKKVVVK